MDSCLFEAKNAKKSRFIEGVFGISIFSSSRREVLKKIQNELISKKDRRPLNSPYFVITVNPEILMIMDNDPAYKRVVQSADLRIADGNGLRLLGINNVYPGRKLVEDLLLINKYRVFYLGGRNGVSKLMTDKYGGEWDEGEREIRNKEYQNVRILKKINRYEPDLLLVAYGSPWQEKWIAKYIRRLKARMVIGVGGTFDFLTGGAKLPPLWMEKLGLEWLWRFVNEPWRWRRQLRLVEFVLKALRFRLF